MNCFGRRSKRTGNFSNPAYTFNSSPPARPASNQNNFNTSTFRPEGMIPDGKGALPSYPGPSSSTYQNFPPPPGLSPPENHTNFRSPPPAFLPSPPDDLDLPPPPSISHDISPASNTTPALADAGYDFCVQNPLAAPQFFTSTTLTTISSGTIPLAPPPPSFKGSISTFLPPTITTSHKSPCPDTCLISALPLYCAGYHHPANTNTPKHIFFSLTITSLPSTSVLAIGFVACPYPAFRLPGWNRGSLGVHSDDGRRYCNDSYGGKDFTTPFREGETVGVGMVFKCDGVEVYFVRGGERVGGWRLDEETDAELDWCAMEGLDGGRDVYAAIGLWGGGIGVRVERFVSE